MISDAQLLLMEDEECKANTSGGAADYAASGSAYSTNVYDTGPRDSGNTTVNLAVGEPLEFFLLCTEAMDAATSTAVVNIQLVTDSVATLASPTVLWETGAIAYDSTNHLGEGEFVKMPLPFHGVEPTAAEYQQFIGMRFTITVQALTAGKWTALIAPATTNWRAYASGLNFA